MAVANPTSARADAPGLIEALRGYLSTWVELVRTRLEIITGELEEERARLTAITLLGVFALASAALGVVILNFFIIALFWEHRVLVSGLMALAYFLAAAGAGLWARKKLRDKPKFLAATLAELRKDREFLLADRPERQ